MTITNDGLATSEDLWAGQDPPSSEPTPISTWGRIDLGPFLDGEYDPPKPTVGKRDDGIRMFYPGRIHSIFSEPEAGKTWLAMITTACEMSKGNDVMFIDFEDSLEGVVPRLQQLGVPADVIRKQFIYVRPDDSPLVGDVEVLVDAVTPQTTLVWIDGVTEAMSLFGLDPGKDVDVAAFWKKLPRRIAKSGPAVTLLDHVVKNQDSRGRWATGSQHKLSGLNGAAYVLENVEPFGVGLKGKSRVLIGKDRPGQVRRHGVRVPWAPDPLRWFADMVIDSAGLGGVLANLYPPPNADGKAVDEEPAFKRNVVLMERVSLFLEDAQSKAEAAGQEFRGYSARVLEKSVTGKGEAIRAAAEVMQREGFLKVEPDGQTRLHRVLKPFRAEDES